MFNWPRRRILPSLTSVESYVDEVMFESFEETSKSITKDSLALITSYFREKISNDIDEMAKHIAETLSTQEDTPLKQPNEDLVLCKREALLKIQNVVSFITNLIHNTE